MLEGILAIAGPLIGLAVKLILLWLGESEKTREAKKRFLEFVASLETSQLLSVNLNKSDRAQADELRAMRSAKDGKKTP